jgi:hypothetical protein
MTHLPTHFEPWVGPAFGRGGADRRLLVLGEAHYSEHAEDDHPGLTKALIRDIRDGRRSIPFFTKIAALLATLSPPEEDPRSVWDCVAFYNYIQGFAASAARVRPSADMWRAASAPFTRVLREVQPSHVLVTGVDLWNALGDHFMPGWVSQTASATDTEPVWHWSSPDGERIRATWINHPSSFGFAGSAWSGRIGALIG